MAALLVTPRAVAEQLARAAGVRGGPGLLALVVAVYVVLGRAARAVLERAGVAVDVEVEVSVALGLVGVLLLMDVKDLERRARKAHDAETSASVAQDASGGAEGGASGRKTSDAVAAGLLRRHASSMPLVPSADLEPWWTPPSEQHTGEQEAAIRAMLESHFGDEAPAEKREKLSKVIVNGDARAAAVRALVARQFNVSATRKLVDDMLQWRAENQIDDILNHPIPDETLRKIRSCLFDGFCGICKQGCPVYMVFGGRMDLAECKRLAGLGETVKYHVQVMEYNMQVYYPMISQMTGRTTSKVTMLLDLKGFGGHNVKPSFWEMINALAAIDNVFYYEWLNKVIIVNAGLFFKFFWRTAAPLLQPETKRKFFVLDVKRLPDHIPLHQLPERFGGQVSDEGSFCSKDSPWTNHYRKFDKHVREQAALNGTHDEPPPISSSLGSTK